MVDFTLTQEQFTVKKTASDFAQREIKPIAAEIDRVQDPGKAFPWEVIEKGSKLGFNGILVPERYGGMGGGELDFALLMEELAAADTGVATTFLVTPALSRTILRFGTEEQKKRWLPPICSGERGAYLLALAATETVGGSENLCPLPDPKLGIKTTARSQGDEYVINGTKCFITNGGLAKLYCVFARTDLTKPALENLVILFVEADTPGLSAGKIEDKMGLRSSQQSELIFDKVRVPRANLVGKEGEGFSILYDFACTTSVGIAAIAIGLARAAYEVALDYAKKRVTWGKPIIQHQAIALMLADMKIRIEAARALTWKAAWFNDSPKREPTLPIMAKVFATDMVMQITSDAIQVLGGYGYMKDYPLEKYMRDAKVMSIFGETNQFLRLGMAAGL